MYFYLKIMPFLYRYKWWLHGIWVHKKGIPLQPSLRLLSLLCYLGFSLLSCISSSFDLIPSGLPIFSITFFFCVFCRMLWCLFCSSSRIFWFRIGFLVYMFVYIYMFVIHFFKSFLVSVFCLPVLIKVVFKNYCLPQLIKNTSRFNFTAEIIRNGIR